MRVIDRGGSCGPMVDHIVLTEKGGCGGTPEVGLTGGELFAVPRRGFTMCVRLPCEPEQFG